MVLDAAVVLTGALPCIWYMQPSVRIENLYHFECSHLTFDVECFCLQMPTMPDCALICNPSDEDEGVLSRMLRGSKVDSSGAGECGVGGSCQAIGGAGICTYSALPTDL